MELEGLFFQFKIIKNNIIKKKSKKN